jgi:hypothetical protein
MSELFSSKEPLICCIKENCGTLKAHQRREWNVSFSNSVKRLVPILVGILVLALMVLAVVQSGKWNDFINPHGVLFVSGGLLFVLIGGVALPMISFTGNEIRRAIMHTAGSPGNDAELRVSTFFWEATGRGFWILGVMYTILSVILDFSGCGISGDYIPIIVMNRALISAFYGILLAVMCLVPYWRLRGKLPNRLSVPSPEQSQTPLSIEPSGLKYGPSIGYGRFFLSSH